MEHSENQITLRGTLQNLPQFSHENHGRKFYKFYLEVPRLSGAVDVLPIIVQDSILNETDLNDCGMITVIGQIRSHNLKTDNKRKLLIFVFAQSIQIQDGVPINDCILEGSLCRQPVLRRTPLGREVCDMMLAVPRAFHRADYLPCILWGRTAQDGANYNVKDKIRIYGRLQSRKYTKITENGPEERVAYEISAMSAEPPLEIP